MSAHNSGDYHLAELKIALSTDHPGKINPPVSRSQQVLDVGCGAGQTLIASCPGRPSFGVDLDREALRLGRTLTPDVRFVCASAERLPFATGTFDLVVSRVALPYTHIRSTLAEIYRILKPGGSLWATLHPLEVARRQVSGSRNPKAWIYFAYVLGNGLLFHFLQKQVAFSGSRIESFQTVSAIRRALTSTGFRESDIRKDRFLVAQAHK